MNITKGTPQAMSLLAELKETDDLVDVYSNEFFDRQPTYDEDPSAPFTQDGMITIEEMENYISKNDVYEDLWVIGGADVYKQFLDYNKINKCYVTLIDHDFPCDTFFPVLDLTQWKEIERNHSFDFTYNCAVDFIVYERT